MSGLRQRVGLLVKPIKKIGTILSEDITEVEEAVAVGGSRVAGIVGAGITEIVGGQLAINRYEKAREKALELGDIELAKERQFYDNQRQNKVLNKNILSSNNNIRNMAENGTNVLKTQSAQSKMDHVQNRTILNPHGPDGPQDNPSSQPQLTTNPQRTREVTADPEGTTKPPQVNPSQEGNIGTSQNANPGMNLSNNSNPDSRGQKGGKANQSKSPITKEFMTSENKMFAIGALAILGLFLLTK